MKNFLLLQIGMAGGAIASAVNYIGSEKTKYLFESWVIFSGGLILYSSCATAYLIIVICEDKK